jgi:Tfp pilus assembly pilus retraction ATPase PilT
MVGTSAIGNLIRENKIHQIPSIIQTGKKDGMQLLDQHIMEFLMSGGSRRGGIHEGQQQAGVPRAPEAGSPGGVRLGET